MRNISTNNKIVIIQVIAFVGSLCAFVWWNGDLALVGVCIWIFLQTFVAGIAMHRYITHESFVTGKWRRKFLIYSTPFAMIGSPIQWAALHFYHHQHSDTELDPHSPYFVPIWKIILNRYWVDLKLPMKYIKKVKIDDDLRFVHDHYFKFVGIWALVSMIFGVEGFIYLFCVPILLVDLTTNISVIVHHWEGYRNYETNDKSTNSWIMSIITLGDGWHNNHHRSPSRYILTRRWWEIDVQGLIIHWFFRVR